MSTTRILVNLTGESHRHGTILTEPDLARLNALGPVTFYDHKVNDDAAFRAGLDATDVVFMGWSSRPLTAADLARRNGRPLFVAYSAGSIRATVPKELLADGTVRATQSAIAMAPAVAQWTVALILTGLRQTNARHQAASRGERWFRPAGFLNRDLGDLTVALIGLSQVGRRVPPLLQPFGCRMVAYDPYWKPEQAAELGVTLETDLDAIIAGADVLSLHAPVTDETRGFIDARRIALLPAGAIVVNTARSAIIDEGALFARAAAGELQAYVDVTEPEPLPPEHSAWQSPNIFITPHIAGATAQTIRRLASHAIDEIERYLAGQPLATEVTFDRYELLA